MACSENKPSCLLAINWLWGWFWDPITNVRKSSINLPAFTSGAGSFTALTSTRLDTSRTILGRYPYLGPNTWVLVPSHGCRLLWELHKTWNFGDSCTHINPHVTSEANPQPRLDKIFEGTPLSMWSSIKTIHLCNLSVVDSEPSWLNHDSHRKIEGKERVHVPFPSWQAMQFSVSLHKRHLWHLAMRELNSCDCGRWMEMGGNWMWYSQVLPDQMIKSKRPISSIDCYSIGYQYCSIVPPANCWLEAWNPAKTNVKKVQVRMLQHAQCAKGSEIGNISKANMADGCSWCVIIH